MEFIGTWWKCPNDALFVKKLGSEFWKCIIVMFQLRHDFYPFSLPMALSMCYLSFFRTFLFFKGS